MVSPRRIKPGPGQESVWDYPRPPRLEPTRHRIRVVLAGQILAETNRAIRVLETSHPPNLYIPPEDVRSEFQVSIQGLSFCEWKGRAVYHSFQVGNRLAEDAAWSYPAPNQAYIAITGYLAFYPGRVDACYIDDELVVSQEGNFYGGWITSKVVGPFKGPPGTMGW